MTATYLSLNGQTHAFAFTDQLRPGAEAAIAALRAQGKAIKLVSGDSAAAVAALAQRLGIDDWVAGALPAEKAALVRALSDQGRRGADGRGRVERYGGTGGRRMSRSRPPRRWMRHGSRRTSCCWAAT